MTRSRSRDKYRARDNLPHGSSQVEREIAQNGYQLAAVDTARSHQREPGASATADAHGASKDKSTQNDKSSECESEHEGVNDRVARHENFFSEAFGNWGYRIVHNPCRVFWLPVVFLMLFAQGSFPTREYEEEQAIWSPEGNPSVVASQRAAELFPSAVGVITALAEVKNPGDGNSNILTPAAVKELSQLHELIMTFKSKKDEDNEDEISYRDICLRRPSQPQQDLSVAGSTRSHHECIQSKSLLSFALNGSGQLDLSLVDTQSELMQRVKSGKGGFYQGSGSIIELAPILGGTTPETITQDKDTGINNIEAAKSAMMSFPYSLHN